MLLLATTTAAALACGGLFCNNDAPVDQSGEQIVFDVDEDSGTTTMHVNVAYEGPSELFAWVVPVNGLPDMFRSHTELFRVLDLTTAPLYNTLTNLDKSCDERWMSSDADTDTDTDADSDSDSDTDTDGGGVTVLATDQIASYEITVLSATDAVALTEWLQANDYDLPDTMSEALEPYVAGGMNFAAIKLAKDTDAGDLPPLGITYEGTTPMVPLQLTSVAAVPDMPVTVYLAGDARGVPTNYLHVRLNPMAVDYFSFGNNLDSVVGRAADEAGGQAFATLSALKNPTPAYLTYHPSWYDPESLHDATHAADFVDGLARAGFAGTPEVLEVLRTYFPVPDDFPYDENSFYNSPSYYRSYYDDFVYDPLEVVDALVDAEIAPRQVAQELLDDMPWITRLRSSVSPSEMTLDPQFGFNPDLEVVGREQTLAIRFACDLNPMSTTVEAAPQLLSWPTGQQLWIPSLDDMFAAGLTYSDFVDPTAAAALYIEQMSTQGPPEILVDNSPGDPTYGTSPTDPATSATNATNDSEASGCGCNASSTGGTFGLLLGLGAVVRRRR